ncbi:MAG: DUF4864 domain-containing protein [Rhodospirillaceae bacterium]|jgi:hypothetical protein|nr:DUF4864 domain-containing protein [Rhodospirillaceae bacterium]MBT3810447.1 DUF4864 domain-containing protein [Rhodospirillaceae bacterium]MBT3929962.1 DUF4864 domain-containing protein [Rhodospirillaceae bacterium]MBT4771741.1 DUF4864 domain-containing protein [Rhodospirillaceae bacterium]MBT5357923.1 DUF4864 domain-containing protein [Rhodospirillaceae bacterium]
MSVTIRTLLVVLLVSLSGVFPARAQTTDPDPAFEGAAFAEVIEGQIAAFSRDDGIAAFALASPDIRRRLMTAERFMAMVRSGFQPVYRPRSYSFGNPAMVEGIPVQPVQVIGPDGRGVVALYRMERQPDGSWRIAGVTLHPTGERGI